MRAPVLVVVAFLLAGCDRPQVPSVNAIAADPTLLHRLLAQCRHGQYDAAFCARVDQADLQRFLSGKAGPHEYRTLSELPAGIPSSFDSLNPSTDSSVATEARP